MLQFRQTATEWWHSNRLQQNGNLPTDCNRVATFHNTEKAPNLRAIRRGGKTRSRIGLVLLRIKKLGGARNSGVGLFGTKNSATTGLFSTRNLKQARFWGAVRTRSRVEFVFVRVRKNNRSSEDIESRAFLHQKKKNRNSEEVDLMAFLHKTSYRVARLIGSPKLQIIFHKRATKYRSLLRKMIYKDKGCYQSSPPCTTIPGSFPREICTGCDSEGQCEHAQEWGSYFWE